MLDRFRNGYRWVLAAAIGLLLTTGACQRRPQIPALPPPPNYLEIGDNSYERGDYPAAIAAYSAYLRVNPEGAAVDRALLRLGICFALPSNPSQDPEQAITYLNQLAVGFPDSPLRAEAELISHLQRHIQLLQSDVAQRESDLARLSGEMEQQNRQSQRQAEEMEQLRMEFQERQDRIDQLTAELERLKAIDMQRRPSTAPR